ncbi:MAG: flagellar protein [Acetatifactor sp.]|nr:flagellar protein [Acetatifactor sp.]
MNVKNCRNCGRIFNYVSGSFMCPACREKMEVKFQEVKEYIRENRGVGIQEVAEACDVDVSQIRQWLREDRLEVTEDSPILLTCDSCGAPIRSGRYCENCKKGTASGFQDVLNENREAQRKAAAALEKDKNGPKMRYL